MANDNPSDLPLRFVDIKREIAASYPNFQERITQAWVDILGKLETTTKTITREGSDYIPQVNFSDLNNLKEDQINDIKRKGCIVIKDIVDDKEATGWKTALEEFVKANPNVEGFPEEDKQFFFLYWTKSQVVARSHPNMLAASTWLNNLYHLKSGAKKLDDVDLGTPLTYADRFRIRHPGVTWERHPPHVDGGGIERWEDTNFRTCFADILSGDWDKHDPYDLEGRLNARTSMYGRPNQASIFRTFQGWLAMSETAPTEGTLKVFPDVLLSNAYTIIRPFFRPVASPVSDDALDPRNWQFDLSSPDFPGIFRRDGGFTGPRPNPTSHPHFKLDETMTSVPKVMPGDAVFWHCDVIHSVEEEHTGKNDSAVMYIPAVPYTPQNAAYIQRQKDSFIEGISPPDYPQGSEAHCVGLGKVEDILGAVGRGAMGFPIEVA